MSIPAFPHPTNFHTYGPGYAVTLASMASLSDTGHEGCPEEWCDLTALLHTLILDEGMTTAMAAWEAALPESMVADYRHLVGI
jgi:hypothetical protein